MHYVNVTTEIIFPIADHMKNEWLAPAKTSFIKRHIYVRGTCLVIVPGRIITSAIDTIIGLQIGLVALCSAGKYGAIVKGARNHFRSTRYVLAFSYKYFLKMINPGADVGDMQVDFLKSRVNFIRSCTDQLENRAIYCRDQDDFLRGQLISRFAFTLLGISNIAIRVVEGVIAIGLVCVSLITVGSYEHINTKAAQCLKITDIVEELFQLTLRLINPLAP